MPKYTQEKEFENVLNGLETANIKFYQFSLLVLYPNGFWKYYTYISLFLYGILSINFLISGVISIYLAMDDIFVVFEVANAFFIVLAVLMNISDFHFVRKKRLQWYKLLSYCKDDFYEYDCESVREEMARLRAVRGNNMKWFFRVCIPATVVNIFFIFVVVPIVRFILNEEQKTDDTGFNIYLPLPVWSIFNTRTVLGYFTQYFIMLFLASNMFAIFIVYIATVFYFFMELIIQLKILCFALTKHEERIEICEENARRKSSDQRTSSSTGTKMVDESTITEVLKEPIIHHLKIREFLNIFKEFSSFFFVIVLSFNMLIIVAMSVIITRMNSLLFVEGCKFVIILMFEILHIFFFTYCGSLLIEEGYNVRKSLYSIHWYGFNSNQKKIINIFQVQSSSEFLVTAFGIYDINLKTFLQVMQTAYSIFNVFNKIKV